MLRHEFGLLSEAIPYSSYSQYFARLDIKIDDDIVLYIWDTLTWVPTLNPATRIAGYGLNYHGVTIIDKHGAEKLSSICRLWAELFDLGPDQLELTGQFGWTEGGVQASGEYLILKARKGELVQSLRSLAQYADRAASGNYYILHAGI